MSNDDLLKPGFSLDYCLGNMVFRFIHSLMEPFLRGFTMNATFFKELLPFLFREGFHLSKGVYSLQKLDGAFTVYGTKGIQSLWKILLQSADKLIRVPDFLLDESISVFQEQA